MKNFAVTLIVGASLVLPLAASLQVARGLKHGVVVTVFPDGAEKYLSESFWSDESAGSTGNNVE